MKKISSVTRKGQVTIPMTVREKLGIGYGDKVEFSLTEEGQVILKPVKSDLKELYGILKQDLMVDPEERRKEAWDWVAGHKGRD
jgi:AbrB family looped-hinge helix DNA binding protein